MFLNTFSKTFIVLIFVGFAPLHIKGMRKAPAMQTGKGKQIAYVNPPTFSLTELSIMKNILATIEFERNEKGLNVYDIQLDIFDRIVAPIVDDVDLKADDRVVHELRTKIGKVFRYFTEVLNTHEGLVKRHYSSLRRDGKLRFLNKRIEDYRQIVGGIEFIEGYGLAIDEFGADRNLNYIPASLRNIR